jgi:hypothetical protein
MSVAGRPAAMFRHAKLRGDGRVERLVVCDIMMLGLLRWLVVLCFYGRWRLMAGATAFRLGLFPASGIQTS